MTDEEKKAEGLAKEKAAEEAKAGLKAKSTDELIDIIHSTRSEAKGYRLELKDLRTDIESLKGDKAKEEQEKKIAEGKKDEVIVELTDKIAGLTVKSNEWDDYNKVKREELKTKFGDNWLESFVTMPLNDLESLVIKFNSAKEAVDTDTASTQKTSSARVEGLRKDLALALERGDVTAQIQIKRMIEQELAKTK